jgi:hypothetical protein
VTDRFDAEPAAKNRAMVPRMRRRDLLASVPLLALPALGHAAPAARKRPAGRWPAARAHAWHRRRGWRVGCNFIPSTAINQLEMWQGDTFDRPTIERELAWARGLGFTSVRVFLHDLAWKQDGKAFLDRVDELLDVAARNRIGTMLVIFDAVWDPHPRPGPQRAPRPHTHNSGWLQSPGAEVLADPARQDELAGYVQALLRRFKDDRRVDAWDLFNEPDNTNSKTYGKVEIADKRARALELLRKTFAWAREVDPSQPLTAGVWRGDWEEEKLTDLDRFMLEQSDVISFHAYQKLDEVKRRTELLARHGRPLLCTEFMARANGSTFDPHLGYFKRQNVGAYCWGFVAGKSQTIYPWDSWEKAYTAEPPLWFHDILRPDGTPFDENEIAYIRKVTGARADRPRAAGEPAPSAR